MRYRRALLLADLEADPTRALSALASVSTELESVALVVAAGADALAAISVWHEGAAALCASVDVHQVKELTSDGLLEIARAYAADLLVAGAPSLESARLLAVAGKRLGIAVLWPSGQAPRSRIEHAFCIAIGDRTRAAVFNFLRDHADPSLSVSVAGPPASISTDLSDALKASGIEARVKLVPRRSSVRAALDAAWRGERVDLIVLARLPALLLVGYSWPAPVLLVPTAEAKPPKRRVLDVADVVEMDGALLCRVEEVVVGDVLTTASERRVALAAGSDAVVEVATSLDGEVWLPEALGKGAPIVAWVADEGQPDVLAAADQRFSVLRPDATRWTLFDAELDAKLLPNVPTPGAKPLAVRARPTRRVASIRQQLRDAGLEAPVVDARAVLDEGPAYDVAEANDVVRLRRVAARMKSAGYRLSLFEAGGGAPPTPHEDVLEGNSIELEFDNGLARRWLLDGIAQAQKSVSFQVYMAADDDVGQLAEAALTEAGRRGVAVRVLVDSLHGLHGSFGVENPLLTRLGAQQGVELLVSRPLDSVPSMVDLKRRDHRKLVILDGRVALVGGRNLSHEYYTAFDEVRLTPDTTWRMVPWLDAGARVEGPAVGEMEGAFISAWVNAGGSGYDVEAPGRAGAVPLRVVLHRGLHDAHTLDTYLELIAGARSHIYLVNGFPLLLELQHALLGALERGVQVRVLAGHPMPLHGGRPFPGPWATARNTATEVAHSRFDPLVRAGGEVHFYAKRALPGWDPRLGVVLPHVHAKALSVDGERCCVGSANFDVTSSYWESELMIVVEAPALARGFERRIEELLAESVRVDGQDPKWQERAQRRRWMRRWPGILAP